MKGNQTNEVITDKNIKSNNEEFNSNKQIAEIFKDLCKAPIGAVNDDFTIGTIKDSHTDLCIRTIAGHLYANGYRKERVGKWIPTSSLDKGFTLEGYMFCSECDVMLHTCDDNYYCLDKLNYCPMCGARMKGAD